MSLLNLKVSNFRNFSHIDVDLDKSCNLFYGVNGSGKTSFLEAIYYLDLGRSFRGRNFFKIVKYNEKKIAIFGELENNDNLISIGMENDNSSKVVKIGGKISSAAEVAKLLPIQLLTHNGYKILEYSRFRRKIIDWGLFHVEPNFLFLWRKYSRLLKQRNAALSDAKMFKNISVWNAELAESGIAIHKMREQYTEKLIPMMQKVLAEFLSGVDIEIKYHPGWSINSDLCYILSSGVLRDRAFKSTQFGPHRADLYFKVNKAAAHDILSRGQQKILFFVIALAQGALFKEITGEKCVYLIDDFAAELDNGKKKQIADFLNSLDVQLFINGLESSELSCFFQNGRMFHVEQGAIKEQ